MWALGPLTLGIYLLVKKDSPETITEQKQSRNNPYNFTSFMRLQLIGTDPSKGQTTSQEIALRI